MSVCCCGLFPCRQPVCSAPRPPRSLSRLLPYRPGMPTEERDSLIKGVSGKQKTLPQVIGGLDEKFVATSEKRGSADFRDDGFKGPHRCPACDSPAEDVPFP